MATLTDAPSDIKKPLDDSPYTDIPSTDVPPPYSPTGRDPIPSSSSSSTARSSRPRAPIPTSPFSLASARPTSLSSQPLSTTNQRKWFSFLPSSSKPPPELLSTIHSLLRDLIQRPSSDTSETFVSSILTSCREACASNAINFSEVLQERFIEQHGAVYWAIVKRPKAGAVGRTVESRKARAEGEGDGDGDGEEETDMVAFLLGEMIPILPHTISEVRRACMVNSDHSTFMFIKSRFPKSFARLSGSDEILLNHGEDSAGDVVEVEEADGGDGDGGDNNVNGDRAFVVRFDIVKFQLRMRVSKVVRIEWIARGRMWYLRFSMLPSSSSSGPSSPRVALGLSDRSQPTYVDSRLTIHPSSRPNPIPSSVPTNNPPKPYGSDMPGSYCPIPPSTTSTSTTAGPSQNSSRPSQNLPDISIRMQSPRKHLLGEPTSDTASYSYSSAAAATSARSRSKAKAKMGNETSLGFEPEEGGYEVEVPLDGRVLDGARDGASGYVDEHGTLRGIFEARLVKYMSDDCVIC